MLNDYKMQYCKYCGNQQQHYKHWECDSYTICLGCSKKGRNTECETCKPNKLEATQVGNTVTVNLKKGQKVYLVENNEVIEVTFEDFVTDEIWEISIDNQKLKNRNAKYGIDVFYSKQRAEKVAAELKLQE